MDFKERILTAMNHEEPDRVPVMGLIMDPATVNQINDKKPVDFVGMFCRHVEKTDIEEYRQALDEYELVVEQDLRW
jgi:hypothetical protein